jgi:hypothetical protein
LLFFSSENKTSAKTPPLPIAERWFPAPVILEKSLGMHRFVWNLAWSNSAGSDSDEDEYRIPNGPKAVPGIYEVQLTVDGRAQKQTLEIKMDPRSGATKEILQQQLELGKKMYAESIEARRVLAEINSLQKQIADLQQKVGSQDSPLKSALTAAQSEIENIPTDKADSSSGLQEGYSGVASALRVVESGDRAVPSQAIAVYEESSRSVQAAITKWTAFKQDRLPQLNQQLREGNLAPISIAEIEEAVETLVSR